MADIAAFLKQFVLSNRFVEVIELNSESVKEAKGQNDLAIAGK